MSGGIGKSSRVMGGAEGQGQRENLDAIRSVVFKESETLEPMRFKKISGYDFNRGVDFRRLIDSMVFTGFQASNLGDAVEVVNQMIGGFPMRNQQKIALKKSWILHTESPSDAKSFSALLRI